MTRVRRSTACASEDPRRNVGSYPAGAREVKVYEALGDALVAAGMRYLFCVMGHGNLDLIAYLTSHHGVTAVHAHHEQGAVAMADGYARMSGLFAVVAVTQGPGLSNTGTALLTARRVGTPIIVIAADTPADDPDNSQYMDQLGFGLSTSGSFEYVASSLRLRAALGGAFRHLRLRQGPVILDVPTDVLCSEAEGRLEDIDYSWKVAPPQPPAAVSVARIVDTLLESRKPALLAGRGAVESEAGPALRALAEILNAPLVTSLLAGGLHSGHPLDGGIAGPFGSGLASELLQEADCVFAVGADLSPWTTSGGRVLASKPVIQVDNQVGRIGVHYPTTLSVLADARVTTEAVLDRFRGMNVAPRWEDDLRRRIANHPGWPYPAFADRPGELDPRHVLLALNEKLPESRALVTDAGTFVQFTLQLIHTFDPRRLAPANNFGAVGQALAVGIGACFALPGEPVTVVCGDGGFMMSLNDFHTAVRYRLPLQVIVLNDQGYTAERRSLLAHGWSDEEARHPSPDLDHVAEAFGAHGFRIRSLDDLADLDRYLDVSDGPTLIDVRINGEVKNPVGAHIAKGLERSGN